MPLADAAQEVVLEGTDDLPECMIADLRDYKARENCCQTAFKTKYDELPPTGAVEKGADKVCVRGRQPGPCRGGSWLCACPLPAAAASPEFVCHRRCFCLHWYGGLRVQGQDFPLDSPLVPRDTPQPVSAEVKSPIRTLELDGRFPEDLRARASALLLAMAQ